LDLEDIDGVMVGPFDLSASLGIPGEIDHPKVKEACEIVKQFAKAKNKSSGAHAVWPDIEKTRQHIKDGFNFIVYSSDIIMLQHNFSEAAKALRESI